MRFRLKLTARLALSLATALVVCAEAGAAPAPSLRVESVGDPPATVTAGANLRLNVAVSRTGRGLRGAVLAYYLTPKRQVGAGAVRMAGRNTLAPLRHRKRFERAVLLRVPRSTGAHAYFVTACVIVVRGPGAEQPRPCRASDGQMEVTAAAPAGTKADPKPPKSKETKNQEKQTEKSGGKDEDDSGDADPTRVTVFPWATSGGFDDNWLQGLGLALLGLIGALVTVYLFLGDFLPSMGGKGEYEVGKLELDELVEERDAQLALRKDYAGGKGKTTEQQLRASEALTGSLDTAIAQRESALTQQRRRLVAIGMPIYLILGGAFAVLFASNLLQAILIGFGWTAVADRLGLNKELEARGAKRDEVIAELKEKAKTAGQAELDRAEAAARAKTLAEGSDALAKAVREEVASRKKAESEPAVTAVPPEGPDPGDEA
jgi:hypothetical protein